MTKIPKNHPRSISLNIREKLVKGFNDGLVGQAGLIAHGRGEAFDYLLGEKTQNFVKESIKAAAAAFLLAKHPIISINGNAAGLCAKELIELSNVTGAFVEVNIFHYSNERFLKIEKYLQKFDKKNRLLIFNKSNTCYIKDISHSRRRVHREGIYKADVVFVPLEDGDRCEALKKMGKKVICVDLNPLSRTAKKANITIVDNIVRCVPAIIKTLEKLKNYDKWRLSRILASYNNGIILKKALLKIVEKNAKI